MKKRMLSLVLTLALSLSLAVPALAVETPAMPEPEPIPTTAPADAGGSMDYETFQAQYIADYTAAHPEEYAAFDADAWFDQTWSDGCGYLTKEEYMTTWELDDAGFREDMWQESLSSAAYGAYEAQLVEAYRAAHPGELEALDLDDLLESQGYREPWTAYMQDAGFSTEEEARASLLSGYVIMRNYVTETHAEAEAYRAADPESWTGFDADAYFSAEYGGWQTKGEYMAQNYLLTDGEFAENLYVEYMDWNSLDGSWNQWTSDNDLTLVANGEQVDATLTAADGVTYVPAETANELFGAHFTEESVPLRTAAESNGWDVVWNADQNQVVLLDRETLTASLDEDFASLDELFNRLLAAAKTEAGQSYRTTETCDLALTAFNTIDGDKTYTASVKVDALNKDNVWDMTLTVSAADLLNLLSQATVNKLATEMPKFTLKDLKNLFTGVKVRLIMDLNTGSFYWNAPILASFDTTVSEDTWYSVSIGEDMTAMLSGDWDTGKLLYDLLLTDSETGWSATYAYYNFENSRSTLALLFGADRFTKSGDTLTWKMDAATVNDMLAEIAGESIPMFKEYDMTISVSDSGKFTCKAAMRLDMDALAAAATSGEWYNAGTTAMISWAMNLLDFRMAAQSSGTVDKASGTGQFHWKNQFSLDMESEVTRKKTTDAPAAIPPEGAQLVELGSF